MQIAKGNGGLHTLPQQPLLAKLSVFGVCHHPVENASNIMQQEH